MNLGATPISVASGARFAYALASLTFFRSAYPARSLRPQLPGRTMPRPRYRACLQDGLKLDLNHLARKGMIRFGANIGARGISWSNSHRGEIASGVIAADMTDPSHAWFRIAIGRFAQQITLVSRPRHYGGCQWF